MEELGSYLKVHKDYFWSWEDRGNVITIVDGSTIAYANHAGDILSDLQYQGFPPFGALLLAIVATNDSMGDDISHIRRIVKSAFSNEAKSVQGYLSAVDDAVEFMKVLAQLPKEYKKGHLRSQLFQTIFESCHCITSVKDAKEIYTQFTTNFEGNIFQAKNLQGDVFDIVNYQRDFKCLALLLKKFPTPRDIISDIANIPVVEEKLAIEEESTIHVSTEKDFVEELIEHSKTFQAGSLIKYIWAGLNIPYHNILPSDQPIGGVSDLTNKGDYDKLIISEFANDDDVLMSRLANNEALFYQREVPPATDKLEHIVLIDVSLKNWGTPKILSYAVLLSAITSKQNQNEWHAFAIGDDFHPIKYGNIDEVIKSLEIVEDSLHAAEGLEKFLKEYKHEKELEIFYISSIESLAFPALKKVMQAHRHNFKCWITTDASGEISLYKNEKKNKKFVQKIQLPLEEIWSKRPKNAVESRADFEEDNDEFPILFPRPINPRKRMALNEKELYIVTVEGSLLTAPQEHLYRGTKGLTLLRNEKNRGTFEYAIGLHASGRHYFLTYEENRKEIIILNLDTNEAQKIHFGFWQRAPYPNFFFDNNAFHYINYNRHYTITVAGKTEITSTSTTGEIVEIYKLKKAESETILQNHYWSRSYLKNLYKVGISSDGKLQINKHELHVLDGNVVKLKQFTPRKLSEFIYANCLKGKEVYEFNNGSKVSINKAGMIILESPVDLLEEIYEIVIEDKIRKLGVVRIVKDELSIGLGETKIFVDSNDKVTLFANSQSEAVEKQVKFSNEGIASTLLKAKPTYKIYIPTVLDHAIAMGTKDYFTGNDYFYSNEFRDQIKQIHSISFKKYILGKFITNIVEHEYNH